MDALFEIIKKQMEIHRVTTYHMQPILLKIDKGAELSLDINNDFYFFVNAFSDSGILNGRISGIGGGNGLDINPLTANMKIYQYQMFKGRLIIKNSDPVNTLYVEVLRVTPIPEEDTKKDACKNNQSQS